MLKKLSKVFCGVLVGSLAACQSMPPIATAPAVDLDRFMGDWYVIAAIPTFIEKDPYNPIESYQKNADGSIATTFTFRQGSFDGPVKTYHPTGYVVAGSENAEWKMQFMWPFKSEYLIAYLSSDYQQTIIARNSRDYVWLMARSAELDPSTYASLVERIRTMGYDTSKLVKFPHQSASQP